MSQEGGTHEYESELLLLGRAFETLRSERIGLEAIAKQFDEESWTPALESRWLQHADPVYDGLLALAYRALQLSAETLPGLRIKAELLLEYADTDGEDIVSALAIALCRDVLRLADRDQHMSRGGTD